MLFEVLISIGTGLKVKFPIEFLQNITSYNLLYLLTKINIRTESDVLIEEDGYTLCCLNTSKN